MYTIIYSVTNDEVTKEETQTKKIDGLPKKKYQKAGLYSNTYKEDE